MERVRMSSSELTRFMMSNHSIIALELWHHRVQASPWVWGLWPHQTGMCFDSHRHLCLSCSQFVDDGSVRVCLIAFSFFQIYIVYNKRTGKPRGYAFIEYEHERDMHCEYHQRRAIKAGKSVWVMGETSCLESQLLSRNNIDPVVFSLDHA